MKVDVFQNDVGAYLRYSMAQQLSPNLSLRIFQSGPGTFWTNMGEKGPSLMINPGSNPQPVLREPSVPGSEKKIEKNEN